MQENPTYKGYFLTEDGRIYSNKRNPLKLITPQKNYRGYYYIDLYVAKIKYRKYIHRLVAETYIPNPNNLPQVNHIDEDKSNNHVDNLEWVTNQHNAEHSHAKCYKIKTPNNDIIEVYNLRKFCRENNINTGPLYTIGKTKGYYIVR